MLFGAPANRNGIPTVPKAVGDIGAERPPATGKREPKSGADIDIGEGVLGYRGGPMCESRGIDEDGGADGRHTSGAPPVLCLGGRMHQIPTEPVYTQTSVV